MTSNVMLISLLYMLPFVNHVIRIGGYDRHMSRWLNVRRKGHVGHLYARSLVVSYLLCLFLFFAALPPVASDARQAFCRQGPELRQSLYGYVRAAGLRHRSRLEPGRAACCHGGAAYRGIVHEPVPWMFGLRWRCWPSERSGGCVFAACRWRHRRRQARRLPHGPKRFEFSR